MENILTTPKATGIQWWEIDALIQELYQLSDAKLEELGHSYAHEWLQEQIAEDSQNLDDLFRRLLPAIQVGRSPMSETNYKGFGFREKFEGGEAYTTMLLQVECDQFIEKTGDAPDEDPSDD